MAKPEKPITDIALEGTKLFAWKDGIKTLIGNVMRMDTVNNALLGANPILVQSVDNIIIGNNVNLNRSSGNTVSCNNAILDNVNGSISSGADSKLFKGANYANVTGDAHQVSGYASFTSGTANINACEHGVVTGYNNRNGKLAEPNAYANSRVGGYDCVSEGNDNIVEGEYLHAIGNNIIIFGNGIKGNPTIITEAGVYHVKDGVVKQIQ